VSAIDTAFQNLAERFGLELAQVRAEFSAGLKETRNALRITGARPFPVYGSIRAANSAGRLAGWTFRETSGTGPATVSIYEGNDASDPQTLVATFTLTAGASLPGALPAPGVSFGEVGLFVAVTGAVAGVLYLGAVD
jgi:hypothetical protein